MIEPVHVTVYNLLIGVVTGIGVIYFLFLKPTVVEYHQFLFVTIVGLLLFLVGGPSTELLSPELVHWVHGLASILVILGLYDSVKRDIRHGAWTDILLQEPSQVREPADWMLPIDDTVLNLFDSADLVLTPSIIAQNIDYSRDEVNRRLIELEKRGFVTKVDRGKYRITALGRQYLNGDVSAGLRSQLRHLWNVRFSR